jgi:hypothetical protein
MTFLEKQIYNSHLKHSRKGQPWKPRNNFDDLAPNIKNHLQHLGDFFRKFSFISVDDFFSAPLNLHPDEPYPYLDYFCTRKAIKAYNLYKTKLRNENPDNQLEDIKRGFAFIGSYCVDNKINLSDYIHQKNGLMPVWTEHYRQYQVNPYCLMELGDLQLDNFTSDELELWMPNLKDTFMAFKMRYTNSSQARNLVKKASEQIKNFITSVLKNQTK